MVKSSKGLRTKARRKLRRGLRQKFKSAEFLQEFKAGDKVIIRVEPASQSNLPHLRVKGKIGEVVEKRGRSYVIRLRVGKTIKQFITRAEHLKIHG